MRARSLVAALLLVAGAADPRDARIDRLEAWMKASVRHAPGETDQAVALVGGWSEDQLRVLWMDASVLMALMHRTSLSRFIVKGEVLTDSEHVKYTEPQVRRLRALACAASGKATWATLFLDLVTESVCGGSALFTLDGELRQLSARAAASSRDGDANFFVRRAAMLHADIAVTPPAHARDAITTDYKVNTAGGPQQIRVDIADGRDTGLHAVPIHWIIGRTLLDDVRPRGTSKPTAGDDEMVRDWYRVSSAWMQHQEDYDTLHLAHALHLFPHDPDILFLAGCLHETFASPNVQRAAQAAAVPSGFSLDVGGYRLELEQAETLFRQALTHGPNSPETRLRLGHVLLRLGRYQDAARQLRQAVQHFESDRELLYDGELFLGAAEAQLRNDEASRLAFERAAALFPTAQSPLLALSQLARRQGDRVSALRHVERLFALPHEESARDDPWWRYQFAQVRNVDQLLEQLRRRFRASMTP